MSILDFLNPDAGALAPQASQPEAAAAPTAEPAEQARTPQFDPAAVIQIAKAMKELKAEETKKESRLPVMHDAEGRKLGPAGVLLALQRDLRLAKAAGNTAEIERIEALLPGVEQAVEAFVKKSGLSRAQLFPDPTRTVPLDQQAARTEIDRLKARVELLQRDANKHAANSVARFKLLLEARSLQGKAALIASQAGLIDKSDLADAGTRGVWTLLDRKPAKAQQQSEQGDEQGQVEQQIEINGERDRA